MTLIADPKTRLEAANFWPLSFESEVRTGFFDGLKFAAAPFSKFSFVLLVKQMKYCWALVRYRWRRRLVELSSLPSTEGHLATKLSLKKVTATKHQVDVERTKLFMEGCSIVSKSEIESVIQQKQDCVLDLWRQLVAMEDDRKLYALYQVESQEALDKTVLCGHAIRVLESLEAERQPASVPNLLLAA